MSQYEIVLGIPKVNNFMTDLETRFHSAQLSKSERQLFKKLVRCMNKLAINPRDTSLETHEIEALSRKYASYPRPNGHRWDAARTLCVPKQ